MNCLRCKCKTLICTNNNSEEEEEIVNNLKKKWDERRVGATCKMKQVAKWYDERAQKAMARADNSREKPLPSYSVSESFPQDR